MTNRTVEQDEERDRTRSDRLYESADEEAQAGNMERAVELTRSALALAPPSDSFNLRFLEGRLGEFLMRAGKSIEARAVLEASIAAGGDIPATRSTLEWIYLHTDDLTALAGSIRQKLPEIARAEPPLFDGAQMVFALARRSTELADGDVLDQRPQEVAEELAHESGNNDLLLAIRHQRGLTAEACGDIDGAIDLYRELIVDGSRQAKTVERLLLLLEREGRVDEALALASTLSADELEPDVRSDLERRQARLAKRKRPQLRPPRVASFDDSTFGRRARLLREPERLLAFEAERGQSDRFLEIDALASRLLAVRLRGDKIGRAEWRGRQVELSALTEREHALLDERFSRTALEAHGSWFLPDKGVSIDRRLLSPHDELGSVRADTPDAYFAWSVLEPLFDALHRPLELRQTMVGHSAVEQRHAWQSIADVFRSLGIDARVELDTMAYGGGWSRLAADERRAAQLRLTEKLAQWTPGASGRFRALKVAALINAYYEKADRNGRALRTAVVTAAFRQTVVGYFGGDWLNFLHYLGESPHPNEQVTTALAEPAIQVAGASRLAAAAAALGLPAEQAALIGHSLWGSGESPVEARIRALARYWSAFDALHAGQKSGMPSLWGLVDSQPGSQLSTGGPGDFHPNLSYTLLPLGVRTDVEQLWGAELLPAFPATIVSSNDPHFLLAQALGAAIRFWHGIALTAWFVCEGPYSRTPLETADEYYARDLEELAGAGAPIDRELFAELVRVKTTLKKLPPANEHRQMIEQGGLKFELVTSFGAGRLAGFERLRDVITRHRRGWAEQHLDSFVRGRAQSEIRDAAETYQRTLADRNKAPAIKPFARKVKTPVDVWFGGNIADLYSAIGEKCPVAVIRAPALLPTDRQAFVRRFVEAIRPAFRTDLPVRDSEEYGWYATTALRGLSNLAIKACQVSEAVGRPIALAELGREAFEGAQRVGLRTNGQYHQELMLGSDLDAAYQRFEAALTDALLESR